MRGRKPQIGLGLSVFLLFGGGSLTARAGRPQATMQTGRAPVALDLKEFQSLRVRSVPPVYPAEERAQGRSGDVVLRVVLAADGSVASVTPITATSNAFAAAAVASVEQWTYKSYVVNGQSVSAAGEVEIHFRMTGK